MEYVRLGDITDKIKTGPFGSQLHQSDYSESGTPVIMPKDIINGKITDLDIARVSQFHVDRLSQHKLKYGNIVYARRGDIGRCAFVEKTQTGWLCGTGCFNVIINEKVADPKFIFYQLQSDEIVGWIKGRAVGSTLPNLNTSIIGRIPVIVPPLPTQKKIAGILSAYDELIENCQKRIKCLEDMAQNLYKEWFVHFRFPGYKQTKFENGLPVGWKVEKLGNLANISTGKGNVQDTKDTGKYPFFDRSQEIKYSDEYIKDCEAILVPGEGTSFIPRYFLGKFNLHQRCYCVEPNNLISGKYLYYTLYLNKKYFYSVATGATVPSLRQNNFTKMELILPNMEIMEKFDTFVTTLNSQLSTLNSQITNLRRQRDLLLPRLMSGKLEV